ncbi:MAG TPA: iron-containing alcohol dehydrogenase [Actinomycetota bacterium]|nr:iron-containing alcohol dehydrogenase [Actinomycetota bacterium]
MTEFPDVFAYDASDSEDDAAHELARVVESLGFDAPFVVCNVHGRRIAARLRGPRPHDTPPRGANLEWASELGADARRDGADAIVAIGGGRCLDVGKLAAARAGLTLVAVPTQLSHDGLCSPVAVVPGARGHTDSLGAVAPRAVFLSVPTLLGAPRASVAAGIGDLLANPLALRDWALARERGLDTIHERAWGMSVESFALIEPHLDCDLDVAAKDPAFLRRLADALVLSGMAMICAGSSRPASGAEHEISHGIDLLFGGRALHGAQVAFGCVVSTALYGDDTGALRTRLRHLGLPEHPAGLDLDEDDTVRLLLAAPDTRPGRFTILEEALLDDAAARALVKRIWGED